MSRSAAAPGVKLSSEGKKELGMLLEEQLTKWADGDDGPMAKLTKAATALTSEVTSLRGELTTARGEVASLKDELRHLKEGSPEAGVATKRNEFESESFSMTVPLVLKPFAVTLSAASGQAEKFAATTVCEDIAANLRMPTASGWLVLLYRFCAANKKGKPHSPHSRCRTAHACGSLAMSSTHGFQCACGCVRWQPARP